MRLPRDISGEKLISFLKKFGYEVSRQKGSHIRLTAKIDEIEHHITIPNHNPIKIGTLNNILNDLSSVHKISKKDLISSLVESK